jgi:hypothetical protein
MVYAHLLIKDKYEGSGDAVKLIAENTKAYQEYKEYLQEIGYEILDEFVDDDMGAIAILPEDFKY